MIRSFWTGCASPLNPHSSVCGVLWCYTLLHYFKFPLHVFFSIMSREATGLLLDCYRQLCKGFSVIQAELIPQWMAQCIPKRGARM